MRLLVVARPSGWGGTEVNTTLMIETVGTRGHHVDLWQVPTGGSGHYSRRWQNRYGAIDEFPCAAAAPLQSRRWWKEKLGAAIPEIIVLAKGDVGALLPGMDLAARQLRIPVVVVEHEPCLTPAELKQMGPFTHLREWGTAGYRYLQLQQFLAAWRISVSNVTDRALNARLRWTKRRGSVIHPGIPFDEFRPDAEGRRAVRARYGIPEQGLVFGAIGRFHPKKRYDLALRLFAEADLPPDTFFMLVGAGDQLEPLRDLAASLGVADRLRLAGWVDGTERRAHFSALDCFLMLSSVEGLGMTLVEAIACGCRAIATDCGGPDEVLSNPSLGLLLSEGDWSSVIAALRRMAAEPRGAQGPDVVERRRELLRRDYEAAAQNLRYAELLEAVAGGLRA